MVHKITWSPEALKSFLQIIGYLQATWTEKEANQFADRVDEKLAVLQTNPRLGSIKNKKLNIHKTVIRKEVILIYRYRPRKKEVVLLRFWNTVQSVGKG